MNVKISQAKSLLALYIRSGLVPMIWGSPGIGKSDIVRAVAKEYNLKVIDLRLSQCDPTDLMGFPNIDQERQRAGYLPMDTFPIVGDPLPVDRDKNGNVTHVYDGWLLFLDEMPSAAPAVQAAAYKIVLDRMVGIYEMHKNVAIVCAGNLDTDNAIVNPMSTALQSRLAHIELVVDHEEFNSWASANNIDHRITSYIAFKPGAVYTFNADHSDRTYACPRTWEFVNRLLKNMDVENDPEKLLRPALTGVIAEGTALEFAGFLKIHDDLPKVPQILMNPERFNVPGETSILYALSGSLAQHATAENISQMMKFITRLPLEFQVFCLKDAVRRTRTLLQVPAVQNWVQTVGAELF